MYNAKVINKVPIVLLLLLYTTFVKRIIHKLMCSHGKKYEYLCIIVAEHSGRSTVMVKP